MAKKKPRPDYRTGRFLNVVLSVDTHAEVEKLAKLLAREDPLGEAPSKHRTIAVAVREAIERRRASK